MGESVRVVQILLEANADPNDTIEDGETVLQDAAYHGSELIVKFLLGANADVNSHCEDDLDGVGHPWD